MFINQSFPSIYPLPATSLSAEAGRLPTPPHSPGKPKTALSLSQEGKVQHHLPLVEPSDPRVKSSNTSNNAEMKSPLSVHFETLLVRGGANRAAQLLHADTHFESRNFKGRSFFFAQVLAAGDHPQAMSSILNLLDRLYFPSDSEEVHLRNSQQLTPPERQWLEQLGIQAHTSGSLQFVSALRGGQKLQRWDMDMLSSLKQTAQVIHAAFNPNPHTLKIANQALGAQFSAAEFAAFRSVLNDAAKVSRETEALQELRQNLAIQALNLEQDTIVLTNQLTQIQTRYQELQHQTQTLQLQRQRLTSLDEMAQMLHSGGLQKIDSATFNQAAQAAGLPARIILHPERQYLWSEKPLSASEWLSKVYPHLHTAQQHLETECQGIDTQLTQLTQEMERLHTQQTSLQQRWEEFHQQQQIYGERVDNWEQTRQNLSQQVEALPENFTPLLQAAHIPNLLQEAALESRQAKQAKASFAVISEHLGQQLRQLTQQAASLRTQIQQLQTQVTTEKDKLTSLGKQLQRLKQVFQQAEAQRELSTLLHKMTLFIRTPEPKVAVLTDLFENLEQIWEMLNQQQQQQYQQLLQLTQQTHWYLQQFRTQQDYHEKWRDKLAQQRYQSLCQQLMSEIAKHL
jgi:hypothetical protein